MKFIRPFIILILFVVIHSLVANFLPYPFNLINIFVVLFMAEVYLRRDSQVGVFLAMGFLLDIFSVNLFGVNIISIFFAYIMMEWLLKNFLSNSHFYTVFLAAGLSVFWFRLVYLLIIFSYNFFTAAANFFNVQLLIDWLWEGLMTALFSTLIYLLFFRLSRVVNPAYIFFKR